MTTVTQTFALATLDDTCILPAPPAAPTPAAPSRAAGGAAEFARAMEDYKRRHNRPVPTWSEVLEVLRGLGYVKPGAPDSPARHRVGINRAGEAAGRVGEVLARFGGVRLPSPRDGEYGFLSEAARSRALDAARADQGWTSVEPR
jgi:hypothetical protein